MKSELDDRVIGKRNLPNKDYIVKRQLVERIDSKIENKNTMLSQLGSFILSKCKELWTNL